MIFYGRYNKKTEHGRAAKARCMNCLKDGHTSNYCKEKVMCPYCGDEHQAETCSQKGLITTSCTACARHMKNAQPDIDLKALFSKTPASLRHSPLDPTCPTRIAGLVQKERQATALRQSLKQAEGPTPVNPNPAVPPAAAPASPIVIGDSTSGEKDNVEMTDS